MKTAVVFFSLTGRTKDIARLLEVGDTDMIEVRSSGMGLMSLLGHVRCPRFDSGRYDLIIVGCPVWYGGPAPPFMKALKCMDFRGKQVNIFTVYALNEGKSLKKLAEAVKARGGSVGRMMSFAASKKLNEREVRKLLSF